MSVGRLSSSKLNWPPTSPHGEAGPTTLRRVAIVRSVCSAVSAYSDARRLAELDCENVVARNDGTHGKLSNRTRTQSGRVGRLHSMRVDLRWILNVEMMKKTIDMYLFASAMIRFALHSRSRVTTISAPGLPPSPSDAFSRRVGRPGFLRCRSFRAFTRAVNGGLTESRSVFGRFLANGKEFTMAGAR